MKILGTGSYLPETVYDNAYMESIVDTSDQWIVERTGIRERHILKNERSSHMAAEAAMRAMKAAGIRSGDVGAVICATFTPDELVPSMACCVVEELGIVCPAFDVNAACTGFIYALKAASAFLGGGKCVLVIGAETLSKVVNYADRSTCVLFGDGAGAVVLGEGDGVEYIDVNAYGDPERVLKVGNIDYTDPKAERYVRMSGQEVFKFATREFGKLAKRALEATGLSTGDIDVVVPHQANLRIIEYAEKKLKMPREKFFVNIEKTGNTSAASIAIAFDEAVRSGRLEKGRRAMLLGFGGGLTSGVALIRM